jgi:hypothetical protein
MVDFVTPLVAAGFSLAEKIVFSWFEEGKSNVRVSRIETAIASLSAHEAERLRLREDDLMQVTDGIIRELISAAPQLSYVKPRFQEPVVRLDFDPKSPASSNQLLRDLKVRLGEIASKKNIVDPTAARKGVDSSHQRPERASYEILPPTENSPKPPESKEDRIRSSELLGELQRRISDRENPRS